MKEIGIYIHIPFCKSKCYYCDFTSYAGKEEKIEQYINKLISDIDKCDKTGFNVKTIYIGGGTPSFISEIYIERIIQKIREKFIVVQNPEITIEANPGTLTREKLEKYYLVGINRLSIGLQSTDNNLLKSIGRIHTYEEFLENYKLAREVGFKNINVDLILGLPKQEEVKDIKVQVKEIIDLNPEHISVYSLILEEGTRLKEIYDKGEIILPEDEEERKMYWDVKNLLEENGYIHYEISNFAKEGFYSKHNLDCWNQNEYLGFGAAAASYFNKERFVNPKTIEEYLQGKEAKIEEVQDKEAQAKEFMILGLRKIEGVSISAFERKFSINPLFYFRFEISKLTDEELIEVDLDAIKLTKKGLDLANIVWEEFI